MTRIPVIPALVSLMCLAGCSEGGHGAVSHHDSYDPQCAALDATAARSTIDIGATMTAPLLGEEAGLFIEYSEDPSVGEGIWWISVSCDTAFSGYACLWDVYATPEYGLVDYSSDTLDWEDYVGFEGRSTVALFTDTAYELDGYYLYTDAGAPVTFEVYLDGCSGQRYVYWVGDGGVHAGAPGNPISLTPQ